MFSRTPTLPDDLEEVFTTHLDNHDALLQAFMPVLCNHIKADRIFISPRNPKTRVCRALKWRRNDTIPWLAVPGDHSPGAWFVEEKWEIEDPLWRAALNLQPSIYIENLEEAAKEGLLNIDFERSYMFHTAFIHGHAHWPSISEPAEERNFYGSVQPAVFDGPRSWSPEVHDLMERCLVRIAPIMRAIGETAPPPESVEIS